MRKRFCAVLAAASLLIGSGQSLAAASFPDVPSNHWARLYIEKLADKRVLTGYTNGNFSPNAFVTRSEFAKIIVLASGISSTTSSTASSFEDVPLGSWSTQYIESAKASGIINGYEDGLFKPINFVTRAEIAKMVMVAKKVKKASSIKQSAAASFTDINNNWARDYINEAKNLGIIGGYADGTFGPNKNVTRAEVSKIISLAFADVLGTQTTNPYIPKVSISSPTSAENYSTSSGRVTLGGTATDDKGVTEITWTNNAGGKGSTSAVENWTIKDIELKQGLNIITVSATDASGNVGTDAIRVTYDSGSGSSGGGGGGGSNNGGSSDSSTTGTPSLQIQRNDMYWVDEEARVLAIPFTVTNNGTGSAISPQITNATADNGVSVIQPIEQLTGTIPPNGSKALTIKYNVPEGVMSFKFRFDFSCEDISGDAYKY